MNAPGGGTYHRCKIFFRYYIKVTVFINKHNKV